jgi:DNA mismatch repair ATPase MutS
MKDLLSFYQDHINTTAESLAIFKKKLTFSSVMRLSVALVGISFAFFSSFTLEIKVYASIAVLAVFLFILKRHQKIAKQRKLIEAKHNLYKIEKDGINGNFDQISNGIEFLDPSHDFANDIDIFGKNSLFQHINRTQLKDGEKELTKTILSNDTSNVIERQEALKELAALVDWRFDFTARGSLTTKDKEHGRISEWMNSYKRILPKKIKVLTYVFSVLSIIAILGSFYDIIPNNIPYILFFIGLSLTGFYFKKVTKFIAITSKAHQVFADYEKLFELIENQEFESKLLNDICSPVKNVKDKTASTEIKKYAKLLSAIDQRNNVIVAIFLNGFFLTEIRLTNQLEDWVERNGAEVAKWLEVLAKMDALNSLANYVYNHPTFSLPTIENNNNILSTKNAAHPTMDAAKRVGNDIEVSAQDFLIITGANMAGKSTFLRTVAMQIVMGNIGLPTCCEETSYKPIKLITSMRTVDSLDEETSYFFAELKRLKHIKDKVKNENYFIILDEILKGTNSKDKADGSKRFLKNLVHENLNGIIATHDLSLCELSNEMPQIHNYFLDAEIIDDELHFDYKFKEGICKNMNATFLLEKMELVPRLK